MITFLKSPKYIVALVSAFAILFALAVWHTGWLNEEKGLPGRHVDYHKIYDGWWDVACGTATDGSDRRCYIQYVDVYRPRPDFAAAMVEVVYHPGKDGKPDPHIRFDIEPGLSFRKAKVATNTAEGMITLDVSHCPTNTCRFSGETGRNILQTWRKGTTFHMEIDEGRTEPSMLEWPLGNINAILDDFSTQRRKHNLP